MEGGGGGEGGGGRGEGGGVVGWAIGERCQDRLGGDGPKASHDLVGLGHINGILEHL